MRRSLVIIGLALASGLLPTISYGASVAGSAQPTFTSSTTPSERPSDLNKRIQHPNPPSPQSTLPQSKRVALEAAKATYMAALRSAQNGRDLAFADANANLMQSLQSAGKDKAAKAAARATYKAAATGIITAYKQAIGTSIADYKAAIQSISGR